MAEGLSPKFHRGDVVLRRSNPSELGRVLDDPLLDAGEYWYRVQFAARVATLPEEEIDPLARPDRTVPELAMDGRWGVVEAFRRAVAVERVSRQNRSTIYSFNARRIQFQPYQYKPLLKLLDSPRRRLLIADEVGLGKTIEAGLIMAELEARTPLQKVLVVCPSRLRQKWHEELLRRFDEDFEIATRQDLERFVERVKERPTTTRLRAIVSMYTLRRSDLLDSLAEAVDFLDLVIVDEAHHARNPSTLTSNMLRELGGLSRAMILLTATPLHLGSQDLFTLLNALSPTEFRDPMVFEAELLRHQGILDAQRRVRACDPTALAQAADSIRAVFAAAPGAAVEDPLAAEVLRELADDASKTRQDWIDLERRVGELHLLSPIVTRTRKRDVQTDAAVRRAHVVRIPWSTDEDRAYTLFAHGVGPGGWPTGPLNLGQIQRARQAASCLPAAISTWEGRTTALDLDSDEMLDFEAEDVEGVERTTESPCVPAAEAITDSKYAKLVEILREIRVEEPDAKILIFSFFVGTTRYLERKLNDAGWLTLRISGDVPSTPHRPETDLRGQIIHRFKHDPETRVLVSTEVGSEGLDFQFCHHLVNYDLPWNPMVVEQRIGRIDRFGQKSSVVHVYSLVVQDTVEDRILLRLYQRIGIFQRSLGDLELILGETVRELQRDYFLGRLSPEEAERRVSQAEAAINRRRQLLEELERNAADLFGHDEYIRAEMDRVRRLGRFVTERAMLALLSGYLEAHHPSIRIVTDEPKVHHLRAADELLDAVAAQSGDAHMWAGHIRGRLADGRLRFTTDGALAHERGDLELINVAHPLVSLSLSKLKTLLDDAVARLAAVRISLKPGDEIDLAAGRYFLAVFAQRVDGIRSRSLLLPVALAENAANPLDVEVGERLLHLATDLGERWAGPAAPPPLPERVWREMHRFAVSRTQEMKRAEQNENDALYQRRLRVLEAELEGRRFTIRERLDTARHRGRGERVVRMFEAQVVRAEARHAEERGLLLASRKVDVELSEPLACCVIDLQVAEAANVACLPEGRK